MSEEIAKPSGYIRNGTIHIKITDSDITVSLDKMNYVSRADYNNIVRVLRNYISKLPKP